MKVIAGEDGTAMNWPHPTDPDEIEWQLRYGEPTRSELLQAASYIGAYRHLIEMPQQLRTQRVSEIRASAARDTHTEETDRG